MKVELTNSDVIVALTQYLQGKFNSQTIDVSDVVVVSGRKGNGYTATANVEFPTTNVVGTTMQAPVVETKPVEVTEEVVVTEPEVTQPALDVTGSPVKNMFAED